MLIIIIIIIITVITVTLSSENNIRHILRDQWFALVLNEVRPYQWPGEEQGPSPVGIWCLCSLPLSPSQLFHGSFLQGEATEATEAPICSCLKIQKQRYVFLCTEQVCCQKRSISSFRKFSLGRLSLGHKPQ